LTAAATDELARDPVAGELRVGPEASIGPTRVGACWSVHAALRDRDPTRTILALDLHMRTQTLAPRLLQLPGCGPNELSKAALRCKRS
jgi:hypothetical protein